MGETPEERRRRLANRRAAKYRYFKSLGVSAGEDGDEQVARRELNNHRQRDRRRELDESARSRARELNRVRQQLRRQALSDDTRQEIRAKQRERQRARRTQLDHCAKEALRERDRLRVRMRRARQAQAAAAGAAREARTPLPQLPAPPLTPRTRETPQSPSLSLLPPPPPLLPLPITRDARTAISANGVLNSPARQQPLPSGIQLPPVFAGGSSYSYGYGRLDPELPNLQPHLRQVQQQQQFQQLHAAHASLSSFQFTPLPSALAMQAAAQTGVFSERIPPLPHLQMALPQASSLLNAPPPSLLFQPAPSQSPQPSPLLGSSSSALSASGLPGISSATAVSTYSTPALGTLSSGSSAGSALLPSAQQVLPSIAIPPPVRALPPLPDFLNNREPFAAAAASSYFPIFVDHSSGYHDGAATAFRHY